MQHDVGIGLRIPANRSRGGGGIGADGELIGHQLIHSALAHHDQDDIGGLSAQLQSEASAFDLHSGWRAPTPAGFTAGSEPATVLAAHYKRGLLQTWNHDNALRFVEHRLRDSLIGHSHHFTYYSSRIPQSLVGRGLLP